jgi:hypothetical protein
METPFNYTAIIAPAAYFIFGVVIVFMLNKFIGKQKPTR